MAVETRMWNGNSWVIISGQDGANGLSVSGLTATTLPAGSSATASYNATTGVGTLGIPKGDKGDTGAAGPQAIAATVSQVMPLIALGALATYDFAVPGATRSMVAVASTSDAGLLGTNATVSAKVVTDGTVRITVQSVGLAIAAGTRTFNIRVLL